MIDRAVLRDWGGAMDALGTLYNTYLLARTKNDRRGARATVEYSGRDCEDMGVDPHFLRYRQELS